MTNSEPSLTLQLPLPARQLSPNARVHWSGKRRAVKEARAAAREESRRVMGDAGMRSAPRWEKATYRCVFFLPDARKRDADNLMASLKSYLDGIADAGVVVNDSGLWPERPEMRVDRRMPRVEITLTKES